MHIPSPLPGTGPIYLRLAEAIKQQIALGELTPGDKLPTVRELSAQLAIAGGTIRHAYDQLARDGFIDMSQGKGTFVREAQSFPRSREAQAMDAIGRLLDELTDLRFSPREMQMYIQLKLRERDPEQLLTAVAVVECNDEVLSEMAGQLSMLPGIELQEYLLSDAQRAPAELLSRFSLIITTQTHYHELCALLPDGGARVARAVLAPRQQSTIAVARIEAHSAIGVYCRSQRYDELVKAAVRQCPHLRSAQVVRYEGGGLGAFLDGLDALLVAPDYLSSASAEDQLALSAFVERGGLVIPYHYQIDQGSYLHIEERLKGIAKG